MGRRASRGWAETLRSVHSRCPSTLAKLDRHVRRSEAGVIVEDERCAVLDDRPRPYTELSEQV
jgi:hypothetical protein